MALSNEVIANSNITFGTSGARGLVTDFTPEVCAAFALAFAHIMRQEAPFDTLALAIDNRPSSYRMAQAISAGLAQFNIKTAYYGVIPTPALAYYAMQQSLPCIMVTGSHIPFDRNGLKFYRPEGEITKQDEHAILTASIDVKPIDKLPEITLLEDAKAAYIQRNVDAFDATTLSGKRIGIYEHSSAGRDIYRSIFESLGAEVISLGRSDEFVPIDTEAVSEQDKQKAREWVRIHQLDALFSTDGDGDRPLLADEQGEWLRGDILGLICSQLLNIEALATPVSCNTAIDLSNSFKHVARTKIGSPYVIAEFEELNKLYSSVAGFEANGGYMLSSPVSFNTKVIQPLPTRDAVLPAIVALATLTYTTLSELVNQLPKRITASDRIKNFAREKANKLINNIQKDPTIWLPKLGLNQELINTDNTDGLRLTLNNDTIVHFRPSGNAPELRCYVETSSKLEADELLKRVLSNLHTLC